MSMNVTQRMVAVHTPVSIMKEDSTVVAMLDTCSQPMDWNVLVRLYLTEKVLAVSF